MDRVYRLAAAGLLLVLSPTAVTAQTPAAPAPPPVTISGVVYTEYAYALRSQPGRGHINNFDVTRAYLNFVGRFGGGVGGRVTGDIYRNPDGSLAYRLKYGFVTFRPEGSALTFRMGMLDTPFVSYNEGLWDYRMQGPDPSDRAGYLKSADFGAGVDGSWNNDQVTLSSGVFNGEFYNRRPGDEHKDLAARVSVRLLASDQGGRFGGLRLTGFALVGEPTGGGIRRRVMGNLTYRSRRVTLGGYYLLARDRTDSTATAPTRDGSLLSVMGVYRVPDSPVALIGRFDAQDPDRDVARDRITTVVAGVSYQLRPNLRLLANLDHVSYQAPVSAATDAARSQALFQVEFVF
jgi:hypothetical protein